MTQSEVAFPSSIMQLSEVWTFVDLFAHTDSGNDDHKITICVNDLWRVPGPRSRIWPGTSNLLPQPSWRRSVASLTEEKRLKEAVFYLEESIYSRVLDSAMEKAGPNVRRVGPDIPRGSPDEVWLEMVGKNDWIALMRDQKTRRRRLETEALKVHGVAAFAFTGGQETNKRHRRFVRCSSSSQT